MPRVFAIGLAVALTIAVSASAPASGQQSGQSDWAFVKQRAAGVPDAKRQIKSRPKTWKCAGGFDCSELTQWSSGQGGTKKSGSWNKTQELRAGKWAQTDHEFKTPDGNKYSRTRVQKKPDTLGRVRTRTPW